MLCTSAATAATVWVGHTQAAAWSCGEALLTVLWFGVPSLAALAVVLSALWLQDRLLYLYSEFIAIVLCSEQPVLHPAALGGLLNTAALYNYEWHDPAAQHVQQRAACMVFSGYLDRFVYSSFKLLYA